ncbi:HAD hydrolase family protein [Flavobacteriales bacterium]|jgi:3-deoxy-D-manno-octulosonate 8-phosphate phosphatase (KDO 8-P phosphatase)|nr:HAD hydrolase family protein [Flavobacteriales bacterium]
MEKPSYKQQLHLIKTVFLDIDGVITDSKLIMHPSGEFLRNMSTRDGYAIKKAANSGIKVFIISGGSSESMRKRLAFLDVSEIHMGVKDKVAVLNTILDSHGFTKEEAIYMGDDIPDYAVMQEVGISACPKDACNEILGIADYVSHKNGGEGAVRDVLEQLLKIKGKWMDEFNTQAN